MLKIQSLYLTDDTVWVLPEMQQCACGCSVYYTNVRPSGDENLCLSCDLPVVLK